MARPLNKHLPVVKEAPISSILEHVGCSLLGLVNSQGLPFSGAVREGTPGKLRDPITSQSGSIAFPEKGLSLRGADRSEIRTR